MFFFIFKVLNSFVCFLSFYRYLSTLPSNRQERMRTFHYTDERQVEEKTSRSHRRRGKHEPVGTDRLMLLRGG